MEGVPGRCAQPVRAEFLCAARHDPTGGAAYAGARQRGYRERIVSRRKGDPALAHPVLRVQVRVVFADRWSADGVEEVRHPYDFGLPRIRTDEFSAACFGWSAAA